MVLILKKNRLFVIFLMFIWFFSFLNSQEIVKTNKSVKSFNIKTRVVIINADKNEETVSGIADLIIHSEESVNLKWQKIESQTPSEWNLYFCDNTSCHFDLPDSVNLKSLDNRSPVKKKQLKLYVNPSQKAGEGFVRLEIMNREKILERDTVLYKIIIK